MQTATTTLLLSFNQKYIRIKHPCRSQRNRHPNRLGHGGNEQTHGLDDVTNSVEFFSPLPRSIPERLRKHNSIDLSSVVSCDGVYSSEVAAEVPEIVEESVIEPSLLQKRFDLLEPASLPISYEDADENSLSEYSNGGSANLTVDDGERSRDEITTRNLLRPILCHRIFLHRKG